MVLAEEVVMLMVILAGHATTEVFSDVEKDGNKNDCSYIESSLGTKYST